MNQTNASHQGQDSYKLQQELNDVEDEIRSVRQAIDRELKGESPVNSLYQEKQNLEARKRDLLRLIQNSQPSKPVIPLLDNNQDIIGTSVVRRKDASAQKRQET